MIDYREHNQTAKVEEYGLDVWLGQIQELIKKGYELDFKTNENYPLVFGTMYTCVMVKTSDNTEAMRYMEGYTAGKEWGLAQGATRVEGGGLVEKAVITEIEPQEVIQGDVGKLETSEFGEQTYASHGITDISSRNTDQFGLEELKQSTKVDGRKKKVS